MKTLTRFYIVLLISLISCKGIAQNYNSGFDVKMNGYIINLGGKFFFQPCEDSTADVWKSLDNRSFSIWYFREDLYLEAIDAIGDSLNIDVYDNREKKKYLMNMRFFYCSLEISMMFLDTDRFEVYKPSTLQLHHAGKQYPLEGFRVENRIIKLIPQKIKDLRVFYDYYYKKGYTIPQWLNDHVNAINRSNKNKPKN